MITKSQRDAIIAKGADATAEELELVQEFDLAQQKNVDTSSVPTTFKAPATKLISGEVTAISPVLERTVNNKTYKFCMVTLTNATSSTAFPISENMLIANSQLVQLTKNITLKLESRIAGITGYLDKKTGKNMIHQSSGESVVSISLLSNSQFRENWTNFGVGVITGNKAEFQNGLGTFLAGGFK